MASSNKKDKKGKKKNADGKSANSNNKKGDKRAKAEKTTRKIASEPLAPAETRKNEINNASSEWHDNDECKDIPSSEHLMDALMDTNKRYTMWIEVKKRLNTKAVNRIGRSSSEHSSQDYGYSSEHNVSSSSLPSTPEGSEVACSDGCCNHEGDCPESRLADKLTPSDSSLCILREHGGGLTLTQMLEVSKLFKILH